MFRGARFEGRGPIVEKLDFRPDPAAKRRASYGYVKVAERRPINEAARVIETRKGLEQLRVRRQKMSQKWPGSEIDISS